jgi:hypothetical protein
MAIDSQQLFFDERLSYKSCTFCRRAPDSRDHVPPRVLLDKPHPSDLLVVPACKRCNNEISADENYLACMVECALCGSSKPQEVKREKIRRILTEKPWLAKRIEEGASRDASGTLVWAVEDAPVRRVLIKLARGHVAFELGQSRLARPKEVRSVPLQVLSESQRAVFEGFSMPPLAGWPEIGSRAFIRKSRNEGPWIIVQEGRYRYVVDELGKMVRIVLSDYLACEIKWS